MAAFAVQVELLLLDEPTSCLDPLMKSVFQQYVKEAKAQGKTVLLPSHILAEVEALCNRVSILRQGKILESGTLSDLRHLTRTTVTIETIIPFEKLQISGVYDMIRDGTKWRFPVDFNSMEEVMHTVLSQH